MPYIKQEDRNRLIDIRNPDFAIAQTPGELNYLLTLEIKSYLHKHGKSYSTINDIIGALENCKLEFYRRIVVDYENKKIQENGDVY